MLGDFVPPDLDLRVIPMYHVMEIHTEIPRPGERLGVAV